MAQIHPDVRRGAALRRVLLTAWSKIRVQRALATDPGDPAPRLREAQLSQLERVQETLERTRAAVANNEWTHGAWFEVRSPSGREQPAGLLGLRAPGGGTVVSACLVGNMLRLADDPDTPHSATDVWHAVDELYEAMHEGMGHASLPAGRAFPGSVRMARVRALAAWNDAPGRTREDVLELLDRAISRTILAAVQR